jgi:hypothetical protein
LIGIAPLNSSLPELSTSLLFLLLIPLEGLDDDIEGDGE